MLWKWVEGRQGGTYRKKLLARFWNVFDAYLIQYDAGYNMPIHIDYVPHGNHYRLNIVLYGGGKFECDQTIINLSDRVILFRPDMKPHSVSCPKKRLVLSFGFVIPYWLQLMFA